MARDWDSIFNTWAQGPSQTELDKCSNAVAAIKKAIEGSTALSTRGIQVFAQGSYHNRTNVRQDSDVDVCVLCTSVCFTDYQTGLTQQSAGLSAAVYTYSQFKNDVQVALQTYFGSDKVTRGNKAFDVHATTYRVDADVVPAFEYRSYYQYDGRIYYTEGIEIRPDNNPGKRIQNYPQQHYDNGIKKNDDTNRHFKRVVRIFKRLRNEMTDNYQPTANPIPSFLLECLVWNVPNDQFGSTGYRDDVRRAIIHIFNNTKDDTACKTWCEVNNIKYLFHTSQWWNRQAVNDFMKAAWNYAEFGS